LSTARIILPTSGLTAGGTLASSHAFVVVFGADEVGYGLRIFGNVGR
jgi:hypothetical protein